MRGAVTAASGSRVRRNSLPWGRSMLAAGAAAKRLTLLAESTPCTGLEQRARGLRREAWPARPRATEHSNAIAAYWRLY